MTTFMPTNTPAQYSFVQSIWATIKKNAFFFTAFLGFLLVGGLGLISLQQGDLLLYFSDHRTSFKDFFFKYGTKLGEEWSYLGFIIYFGFIKQYAQSNKISNKLINLHMARASKLLLLPLTGLIVTIVSFLSKKFFLHPRPSLYYKQLGTLSEINLVEGVHLAKGLSSFPSGHTMSAFALFTLVALLVENKKMVALLLFSAALIVGLSRIYLVQHFLKDVYLGGIMGGIIALIMYELFIPFFSSSHSKKS